MTKNDGYSRLIPESLFRILLFIVLIWCVLSEKTAYARDWPTTKFVIENSDPDPTGLSNFNPFNGFSDDEEKVIAEYEKYLTEVADWYQSMGFKAPPLPMTEGGKAYRVYMYDYSDDLSIARAGYASDGSITLRLDRSRAFRDKKRKRVERVIEDLAHELFHNVQRGYVGPNHLDNYGLWIMEGQAQAIGMEAARRLRGVDVNKGKQDAYRLGGRNYAVALPTEKHDDTYRTASLWRYIGEYYAASQKNQRPGVEPITPDYSYLRTILEQPFSGPDSTDTNLRWLNAGLRKATGLRLSRLYSSFMATFADYVPARLTSPVKGGVERKQAQENWLDYIFGACPTIGDASRSSNMSVQLPLRKNGSRCFKIEATGTGSIDVSIHTRAESVERLQALSLGTAGGEKIGMAQIIASPTGGGYIGHWRFRIETGTYHVFIVSNMAADATRSINQDPTFNVTPSSWISSMTTPRPQSSQSTPSPKKTKPPDSARKKAQQELDTGLKSLSNQTAMGAGVTFERRRVSCNQDFAVSGCGPVTGITLMLTPGALGDMTMTSGTGGSVGQFMSQMVAIADNGVWETDSRWKAALEEVRDTDGSTIKITIPIIEYGFTGTFSNAAVSVNNGSKHEDFRAIGPEDSIPGRGREYRQSGKVTIEEFTPYLLRGSFEAQLTDLSIVEFTEENEDQRLPVVHTIEGNFSIAAPWEGDKNVAVYNQPPLDSAQQDLMQTFPAMQGFDLSALMRPESEENGAPPPVSTVGEFPGCDCTCQPLKTYSEECRPICRIKYFHCRGDDLFQKKLAEKQKERKALAEDVDQMRADFENHLDSQNMGGIKETLMASFDEQPTAEAKRRLVMSNGMNVGAYGDDETQRRAANPSSPTREEYIQGLKDQGVTDQQMKRLLKLMDEAMVELGGWPDD